MSSIISGRKDRVGNPASMRPCARPQSSRQADIPPKKVRPALGGELAAREPVWDGEGGGCDRVAGSISPVIGENWRARPPDDCLRAKPRHWDRPAFGA